MTFDGVFRYGYDAWNRMVRLTKGYRDSRGALQSGSDVNLTQYDGLGRRIIKPVSSAGLDCQYHYYG